MQRALAAALLAPGRSLIRNPSFCLDAQAALAAVQALGAKVKIENDLVTVDGGFKPRQSEIDCLEAGLSLRMFTPIAALADRKITLVGSGTLAGRPMGEIEQVITALGAKCHTNCGFSPLTVTGPLTGGKCDIDGRITSQFLSGLLLALPLTPKGGLLQVKELRSKPYIDLTMEIMTIFGVSAQNENYRFFEVPGRQHYRAAQITVEGDWSGAAFLLVAAALNGEILVSGLDADSRQADRRILEALEACGACTQWRADELLVRKADLRAFDFDAGAAPDLFPPLVALAVHCPGTSKIHGVGRLRHKESDRGLVLCREFSRLGARISIENDCLLVSGGPLHGGQVDSHRDHRIAMAAAVAALAAAGPVTINDPGCVDKSYPGFFTDLARLGGEIS